MPQDDAEGNRQDEQQKPGEDASSGEVSNMDCACGSPEWQCNPCPVDEPAPAEPQPDYPHSDAQPPLEHADDSCPAREEGDEAFEACAAGDQAACAEVASAADEAAATARGEEDAEPSEAAAAMVEMEGAAAAAPSAEQAETPVDREYLRRLVEGALFTAPGALSAAKLASLVGAVTAADVRIAVSELNSLYERGGHAFRIEEIAGGYRMLTRPDLSETLATFFAKRSKDRLSRAALETLAIVAYKQPATRAAVESIRGVASDSVLANLVDLGLIRVSGQADAPGRPTLYATTKKFLDHFGLRSLRDLPRERDFDSMEKA
jgi:segregation and condensation protein B